MEQIILDFILGTLGSHWEDLLNKGVVRSVVYFTQVIMGRSVENGLEWVVGKTDCNVAWN